MYLGWDLVTNTSYSEHARFLILVPNSRFLGMRNHLGQFSDATNWPEGQEWDAGAVGGQGPLQGVNF